MWARGRSAGCHPGRPCETGKLAGEDVAPASQPQSRCLASHRRRCGYPVRPLAAVQTQDIGSGRSGRNLPGPGPPVQDGTAPEHLRVFAGQAAITSPLTSTHRADQCKQERTAPADDVAHRCLNFRCEIAQRVPDLVFLLWQVLGSEPTLAEPTVLTAI